MNIKTFLILSLAFIIFSTSVTAACSFNSLTVQKQQLFTDLHERQEVTLSVACPTVEEVDQLTDVKIWVNKVGSVNQPQRGLFLWNVTKGFIEFSPSNYGNQYVMMLSDLSHRDVYGQIINFTYIWAIYPKYGQILDNDVSYWWNGTNYSSPVGWTTLQTNFSVLNPLETEPQIYHILSTGQSLSIGSQGRPMLSITQPYENIMLNGSWDFQPLMEIVQEAKSSAMGNFITANTVGLPKIEVTRHGQGGYSYVQLKKGTAPYNTGMGQVDSSKSIAQGYGHPYKVIAVTTVHGEKDHTLGTNDLYEQYLVEWQRDYENDTNAKTGQNTTLPLFTDQMSSFTYYKGNTTSRIPIAQLAAAEHNPGKIYLVTPKYIFAYADGLHLNNTSYRWLGEYYGKVIKKVVFDQEQWVPLSPNNITRQDNVITVVFNVPVPPIQFDTVNVLFKNNYGFEYYGNATTPANITSVAILGPDTIKITLNTIPAGLDERLRYAYTGTSRAWAGAFVPGSARGNIHDNDTTPSLYNNTLYNWLVQFDKPIAVVS